jgi:uncharacterized protein with ParB-like and HNH nuclease domain
MDTELSVKSFRDLCTAEQPYTFIIPPYQRGYRWTEKNVERLLDDFSHFIENPQGAEVYCMQPLAVKNNSNNKYTVIDGQQRLTTLYILHEYLDDANESNSPVYSFEFSDSRDSKRLDFLKNLKNKNTELNINEHYMKTAYDAIKKWFEDNKEKQDEIRDLLLETKTKTKPKKIEFIWYEVNDDEHNVFRNLNSGKIQLTNADLIKAVLLSGKNGLDTSLVASQLMEMEYMLKNDRFWYMLQRDEPIYRGARIDIIYNLAEKVSTEEYDKDPLTVFNKIYNNTEEEQKVFWENVKKTFTQLSDLYENPITYHYIGYLTFIKGSTTLSDYLSAYSNNSKNNFIKNDLPNKIKDELKLDSLENYSYENGNAVLQKIFVLHNVETIVQRYQNLVSEMNMHFEYEYFPFDLLYKQTWNIEHISSQTDNTLSKEEDREDWIKTYKNDYKDTFEFDDIKEISKSKDDFDKFYASVVNKLLDKPEDNKIPEENKNGLGNLVLLDEHTNKSYQNALFPRKRITIINADNGKGNMTYIPLCTKNVFLKYYNDDISQITSEWTKTDYEKYLEDIKLKLHFYLPEEKNSKQGE